MSTPSIFVENIDAASVSSAYKDLVFRFIDRMHDVCAEDTAQRILGEFVREAAVLRLLAPLAADVANRDAFANSPALGSRHLIWNGSEVSVGILLNAVAMNGILHLVFDVDGEVVARRQVSTRPLEHKNIHLVWAQTPSRGVIGRKGTLPWHNAHELRHFKELTEGHTVVMGRKTWESLPETSRPLPNRRNIVLSRKGISLDTAAGVEVVENVAELLLRTDPSDTIFCIGGAEVYAQLLPFASKATISLIPLNIPDGDTFAPHLGPEWALNSLTSHPHPDGLDFRVLRFERIA